MELFILLNILVIVVSFIIYIRQGYLIYKSKSSDIVSFQFFLYLKLADFLILINGMLYNIDWQINLIMAINIILMIPLLFIIIKYKSTKKNNLYATFTTCMVIMFYTIFLQMDERTISIDTKKLVSDITVYIAVIYMWLGYMTEICQIIKFKSTGSLDIVLFTLFLVFDIFYILNILLVSEIITYNYVIQNLPLLIGFLGCIIFDVIILYMFYHYKDNIIKNYINY